MRQREGVLELLEEELTVRQSGQGVVQGALAHRLLQTLGFQGGAQQCRPVLVGLADRCRIDLAHNADVTVAQPENVLLP